MFTDAHLAELRKMARAVTEFPATAAPVLKAHVVAQALSGTLRWVATTFGAVAMRTGCAEAIQDRLRANPNHSPATQVVVAAADGLAQVASVDAVNAALAFWASEDVAVWCRVVRLAA